MTNSMELKLIGDKLRKEDLLCFESFQILQKDTQFIAKS